MTTLADTRQHADWKTSPGLGAAGRAATRVLVWIALWAEALRTVAAVAGVWSAGSWGIFATLFVGVIGPAWMFLLSPTWFGWRVLYRVDLPPAGRPKRARAARRPRLRAVRVRVKEALLLGLCWLSPLCRARELAGIRVFVRVRAGRPFPETRRIPADPWTILAAALQAERQGNVALAEQIVDALVCMPAGGRFPMLARVHGGEALMLSSIRRRDWPCALRHAALARGRLVRLLTSIAEAHTGAPSSRRRLWARWALAPGRLRTFRLVREASARLGAPARVTPPPSPPAPDDDRVVATDATGGGTTLDPRAAHVHLLGQAARGFVPPLGQVLALASAWSRALDAAAMAHLGARALELDVRAPHATTRAIRERVVAELSELAARADGVLPEPEAVRGEGLAEELVHRARERLGHDVELALAPLVARDSDTVGPLEAWTRWLALRTVLEDVERRAGRVTLTMLWHGSVRNTVWRWASALFNRHPTQTAWIAHMIFAWVADHAELVGDLGGQLTNRENARIALAAESRNPW